MRVQILDAWTNEVRARYGPRGGTDPVLRRVTRGRWDPTDTLAPRATIVDGGQDAAGQYEGLLQPRLAVQTIFNLDENWGRESALRDWSAFVDRFITDMYTALTLEGCNIVTLDYASDAPWEAVLADGSSRSVWIVEHNITYSVVTE
jgi:hypothetical protein